MSSGGWGEGRYVVVSMAELVRIPEFLDMLSEDTLDKDSADQTLYKEVDETKAELLKDNGQEVTTNGGKFVWTRKGFSLNVVKKFLVEHLEASSEHDVEVDFVKHRTTLGEVVTCERFWTFHKDSKYVEQELFDDLNKMSNTSLFQGS